LRADRSAAWKRASGWRWKALISGAALACRPQGRLPGRAIAAGAARGRTSGLPCHERAVRPSFCSATADARWRRSSWWQRR
jgi:hypothetical protein